MKTNPVTIIKTRQLVKECTGLFYICKVTPETRRLFFSSYYFSRKTVYEKLTHNTKNNNTKYDYNKNNYINNNTYNIDGGGNHKINNIRATTAPITTTISTIITKMTRRVVKL